MSRFATALKVAIEHTEVARATLCDQCQIEPAALSKYLHGKILPRKPVLARIAKAFPAKLRPPLYIAYIKDQLPDDAEEYIYLSQNTPPEGTTFSQKHDPLPADVEEAFTKLRTLATQSHSVSHSVVTLTKVLLGVDLDKVK